MSGRLHNGGVVVARLPEVGDGTVPKIVKREVLDSCVTLGGVKGVLALVEGLAVTQEYPPLPEAAGEALQGIPDPWVSPPISRLELSP